MPVVIRGGVTVDKSEFRGVVLGSCWRLAHRFFTIYPDLKPGESITDRPPTRLSYVPQPWETEPLIRRLLLYFDRITFPVNDVLPAPKIPGLDFLIDAGALETKKVVVDLPRDGVDPEAFEAFLQHMRQIAQIPGIAGWGHNAPNQVIVPERVAESHRRAFIELDRAQPGAWAFATVGEGLDFSHDEIARGYEIELVDCLPVPSHLASYDDIIRFKRDHASALADLRATLDDAYTLIVSSSDPSFVSSREIKKLEQTLRAVITLMDSRHRLAYLLSRVKVEINPLTWVGAILREKSLEAYLAHMGLSIPLSELVAGVYGASLVVKLKNNHVPVKSHGAYTYVYEGVRDGIISRLPVSQTKE